MSLIVVNSSVRQGIPIPSLPEDIESIVDPNTKLIESRIIMQTHPSERDYLSVFASTEGFSRKDIVLALNRTWHRTKKAPFVFKGVDLSTGLLL